MAQAQQTTTPDTMFVDPLLYYDHGWNARVRNEPFQRQAMLAWRDGWKDCDGAPEADRTLQD